MQARLARPLDRAPGHLAARREADPLGRFLRRLATALGLFFLARDASLHVESVSPQRQPDTARRCFWWDGGNPGV